MLKCLQTILTLGGILLLSHTAFAQDEVEYGFVQDPNDPLFITAVAYPNFTSNNVTISTAVFSFVLPEGTLTTPSIPVAPGSGSFNDSTGTWTAQLITPTLYSNFGFDPAELQGNDVYQVVLQNSPILTDVQSGVYIPLFAFRLPNDCMNGNVEILTNDGAIQQSILMNLGANFNNQMSMSIDDAPSTDIYAGNAPGNFSFPCPLNDAPAAVDDAITILEDSGTHNIDVLNNDSFGDNGPATGAIVILMNPLNGTATVDTGVDPNDPTDDSINYTSNLHFNGLDSLTYYICDFDGDCDTATVLITVDPVNDPPVAMDDSDTTNEDTPVTTEVLANDDDPNDPAANVDPTSVAIVDSPNNGTVSVNPVTGEITYTPDPNFNGSDTYTYEVCDTGNPLPPLCDTATVTIDVTPVNDPPVIDSMGVDVEVVYETTPEDTPVTTCVSVSDPDMDILSCTLIGPSNGSAVLQDDTCVVYTPDPNYNGQDTLWKVVCDPFNACDTVMIVYTVDPVNDAPIANDDSETTDEDTPVTTVVIANDNDDADPAGGIDPTSVAIVDSPNNGTVSVNPVTGEVTYTPDPNFIGTDTYTYEVCDTGNPLPPLCDTATVTIDVTPVNDPPVIDSMGVDVEVVYETTPEDTPVTTCVSVSDPDMDILSCTLIGPSNGSAVLQDDTCVVYTPDPNYNGQDTLWKVVCDPFNACDTVMIVYTIDAVNDAPLAMDDTDSVDEDGMVTTDVVANDNDDADPAGGVDPTSVAIVDPPDNGTVSVNPVTGEITYTPDPDFNGIDTYSYEVCDTGNPLPPLCDTATVTITVNPINDGPIANDDTDSVDEDGMVTTSVLANDNDDADPAGGIDPTSVTITTSPANGTVSVDPVTGDITYTPDPNFNGVDTYSYQVCDTGNPLPELCDIATVTITVNPINDAPVAMDDTDSVDENTPVTTDVVANDDDPNDPLGNVDPTSVTIVDPPANGMVSVDPVTGEITYTPDPYFYGTDTYTYAICDTGNPVPVLCDTAAVAIMVNPVFIRLQPIVLLQGPLIDDGGPLMDDALRANGYIPLSEPYSALGSYIHESGGGGEMITDSAGVLADYGANSIVDWVFVELRDSADSTDVIATRAALVQRDGDVVDVDGVSPVLFTQTMNGTYFVSIRHRNHIGAMVRATIPVSATGTIVDFTDTATDYFQTAAIYDTYEQANVGGSYALWAGNTNADDKVVYAGQDNDKDPIFNEIDQAPGNPLKFQTYIYNGYHLGDVKLDGATIFAGQDNDVDAIFNNIDAYPANLLKLQTFVIPQQLPQ
ncbi:MAG: tandem-95 repeat protein [Bacteroidetes bacterium]|nr:tandem-95 repeat protein [Bacteroidota bacterium]